MPTYEYHCSTCNASYELRQGFSAETTHPCEECGKGIAKRVLYAPPIVFKGSGWYITDSRNKSTALADAPADSTTPATETTTEKAEKVEAPAPAKIEASAAS